MTHAAKAAVRQDGAACRRRPAASASGGADERPLGVGADGVSTDRMCGISAMRRASCFH